MSSSSSSDTASSLDTTTRFTGVVKWFNNKAGFGFITVLDNDVSGDYSGKDVLLSKGQKELLEEFFYNTNLFPDSGSVPVVGYPDHMNYYFPQ